MLLRSGPATAPLQAGFATSSVLTGRPRLFALALAATVAILALTVVLFAIPALQAQRSAESIALQARTGGGAVYTLYAAYWTALHVGFALTCLGAAALVVRHRTRDRVAIFVALVLVLLGIANAPLTEALAWRYPSLAIPIQLLFFLTLSSLVVFLFVFPDGRFVPRQARLPLTLGGATAFLLAAARDARPETNDLLAVVMFVALIGGVTAQCYRYFRVSDTTARQQTKLVVAGVLLAVAGQVVGARIAPRDLLDDVDLFRDLVSVSVIVLGYLAIPLSIAAAIVRRHLWGIEVVIRHALVYGALTASIVAIYVLVVGGLGMLFQTTGSATLGLLATSVAAVAFQPLRQRMHRGVNRVLYGERDDPYRVLSRLGERLEATLAPDAVLPAIVESVREALKLPYAGIALREDQCMILAAESGQRSTDLVELPLSARGELLGTLRLARRHPDEPFSVGERRLLEDLARQAGVAVEAMRLTVELQRSRERLVGAREEERRRLRRDLHDGLGSRLAGLTLRLETARDQLANDPAGALLKDLAERARDALADIRQVAHGLRPPALDDLGLISALREQAAQHGYSQRGSLEVLVEAPETLPLLPAAVEVAAYRIVQEALANVARHARARRAMVRLTFDKTRDELVVEVSDDGCGIEPGVASGVGLISMRERAGELGGGWRIERLPDGGTRVWASLPCVRVEVETPSDPRP